MEDIIQPSTRVSGLLTLNKRRVSSVLRTNAGAIDVFGQVNGQRLHRYMAIPFDADKI